MRQRFLALLPIFFLLIVTATAQTPFQKAAKDLKPDKKYDNVLVQRLFSDGHASGFVIWIKQSVPLHMHASHSETVVILAGSATMTLGNETLKVKKGDIFFIPQGMPHSVTVQRGVLKVMSLQAPEFDGTDRVPIQP